MNKLFLIFSIIIIMSCNTNNEEKIAINNKLTVSISDTSLYNYICDYIKFKKENNPYFFKDNILFVNVSRIQDSTNFFIENSFKFNIYSYWKGHIDSSMIKYYQQTKIEDVIIYFNSGLNCYLDIKYEKQLLPRYKQINTGIDPDLYVLTIIDGDKRIVKRSKILFEQKFWQKEDSLKKVDSIMYRDKPLFMKDNDSAIVSSRRIKNN